MRSALTEWTETTLVSTGAIRSNFGIAYVCTTGGTTGAAPGPIGYGSDITDGTAVWDVYVQSIYAVPPDGSSSDTASDLLWFDIQLLVEGLKLAFRKAKGFDTSMEQAEYDASLAAALGGDGMAPSLSLTPRASTRLVDGGNLPETGFGS